jgi:hypothetical protein
MTQQRSTNNQPVQMMFPQGGNAAIYAKVVAVQEKFTNPSQTDTLIVLVYEREV